MKSIEFAAEDFLNFHPEFYQTLVSHNETKNHILVVLGSERGFCGNYNELLCQATAEYIKKSTEKGLNLNVIAVGYKIHNKFDLLPEVKQTLFGPRLTEDIPTVIAELTESIDTLCQVNQLDERRGLQLTVLYHREQNARPEFRQILPAFQTITPKNSLYTTKPQTYLSNIDLYVSLLDEYLFASLNQLFYAAFMAENLHRVRHMENALNKLSKKITGLSVKRNEVRQEEITEELEVIMLSSSAIEETAEES